MITASASASATDKKQEPMALASSKGNSNAPPDRSTELKDSVKRSWAAMIGSHNVEGISDQEFALVQKRVDDSPVSSVIATIVSNDPKQAAGSIPYYRNTKLRIFSLFKNEPAGLTPLQDLIIYLIKGMSKASVIKIDFTLKYTTQKPVPKPSVSSKKLKLHKPEEKKEVKEPDAMEEDSDSVKYVDVGSIKNLEMFYQECIYVFRLKRDIDYELSVKHPYTVLFKWVLQKVRTSPESKLNTNWHLSFTAGDHAALSDLAGVASTSLQYKALTLFITLLAFHYRCEFESPVKTIITNIINGTFVGIKVPVRLSDVKDIDAMHVWPAILSPLERSWVNRVLGKTSFLQEYNKLLNAYRRHPASGKQALQSFCSEVKRTLPDKIYSIIYGRLKSYHELRKAKDPIFQKVSGKETLGSTTYANFLECMCTKQNKTSLMSEETFFLILFKGIALSNDASLLASALYYNNPHKRLMYERSGLLNADPFLRTMTSSAVLSTSLKSEFFTLVQNKSDTTYDPYVSGGRGSSLDAHMSGIMSRMGASGAATANSQQGHTSASAGFDPSDRWADMHEETPGYGVPGSRRELLQQTTGGSRSTSTRK